MDYILTESDPHRQKFDNRSASRMSRNDMADKMETKTAHGSTAYRKTILKLGANFCSQTSMHGLGQIVENVVTVAKVFWFLAFCVALAANCYHISELVTLFMKRPVQESSKLQRSPIHFPAVTVCSQDPFSKSSYARLASDPRSKLHSYLSQAKRMLDKGLIDSDMHAFMVSPVGIKSNIGAEETRQIGHQLKDLILRCTFRGLPCDLENDFKFTISASFYNCYTFDPGSKADNFVAVGAENGLSLISFLETTNGTQTEHQYHREMNNGNALGLKVMIHGPGLYPIPHLKGLDVMPGHSTSFGFYLEKVTRLGKPYGKCTNRSGIDNLPGYSYDSTVCLNSCLQTRTIETCGCRNVMLPDSSPIDVYCGTLMGDNDIGFLATYNLTSTCSRNKWEEFSTTQSLRKTCGCMPPCRENYYRYTITESVWPSPQVYSGFLQEEVMERPDRNQLKAYTQLKDVIPPSGPTAEVIQQNFARINVFLSSHEVLERIQSPAYPISNLFSDIGGTLGLWAGLSVLTIVEVIQLCVKFGLVASGKTNIE